MTTSPSSLARILGRTWLRAARWEVRGALPCDVTRAVLIASPHTSNWDLPHMLAFAFVLGLRPRWLGKREMFRGPAGPFFRWLGGVPVDRSRRANLVEQAVELFARPEPLVLVVPPSGTRGRVEYWRSGFYHIARGAGVPIVCSFLDYGRGVGGIGPVLEPSGDLRADMETIRRFYAGILGRYPALTAVPRLREEDEIPPVRARR